MRRFAHGGPAHHPTPDKRLKQKSEPVESVDSEIVKLMDDMLETVSGTRFPLAPRSA